MDDIIDTLNYINFCVSSGGLSGGFSTKMADGKPFFNNGLTLITVLSDLAKPSKEQLALQMELQRLKTAHSLDEKEFDSQKQVLQAQLQTEVSYNHNLVLSMGNYEFFFLA